MGKGLFVLPPCLGGGGCSAPAGAGARISANPAEGVFRACGRGLLFPRRKSNQKFAKTCGFGIPSPLSTPMAAVRRAVSIRVVSPLTVAPAASRFPPVATSGALLRNSLAFSAAGGASLISADALVHRCAAACVYPAAPSWAIAERKLARTILRRPSAKGAEQSDYAFRIGLWFLSLRGTRRGDAQRRARHSAAAAETGNTCIDDNRAERSQRHHRITQQAFPFFGSLKTVLSFSRKGKNWFQKPPPYPSCCPGGSRNSTNFTEKRSAVMWLSQSG